MSAGFALANSLYCFFFVVFSAANLEIVGIQCAKCDGAKNYLLLRQTFFKSLFMAYMILLMALCFYCRADLFLMSLGILEDTSKNAHRVILFAIPGMLIQAYNEVLKVYLVALGYTAPFLWLNILLICLYPILGYVFICVCGLPLAAFGIILVVKEIITLVVCMFYVSKMQNPEHNFIIRRNRINSKELFNGMGEHVIGFIKLFGNVFIPYMAFELTTILIGSLKDNSYSTAWANVQSLCGIGYCLGGGFGQTARTAVSNFVGKQRNEKAKEYGFKSLLANFIFAVIYGLIMIIFRYSIARGFSDIPGVQSDLVKMLFIFGFIAFSDVCINLNSSLVRIIGYSNVLSATLIINSVIVFNGLNCLFLLVFNLEGYYVMWAFFAGNTLTFIVFIIIIFFVGDWNNAKREKF